MLTGKASVWDTSVRSEVPAWTLESSDLAWITFSDVVHYFNRFTVCRLFPSPLIGVLAKI